MKKTLKANLIQPLHFIEGKLGDCPIRKSAQPRTHLAYSELICNFSAHLSKIVRALVAIKGWPQLGSCILECVVGVWNCKFGKNSIDQWFLNFFA